MPTGFGTFGLNTLGVDVVGLGEVEPDFETVALSQQDLGNPIGMTPLGLETFGVPTILYDTRYKEIVKFDLYIHMDPFVEDANITQVVSLDVEL